MLVTTNQDQTNLILGEEKAPQKLVAFFNLGCPDTKKWWDTNVTDLLAAVTAGRLQVQLNFWSKPKPGLQNGNVAHEYLDYQHPEAALAFVRAVFDHQPELRALEPEDVPGYLQQTFSVQAVPATAAVKQAVAALVAERGVLTVPTLFLDGGKYTGDTLSQLRSKLN